MYKFSALLLSISVTLSACVATTSVRPPVAKMDIQQERALQEQILQQQQAQPKQKYVVPTDEEMQAHKQRLGSFTKRIRDAGMGLCADMRIENDCNFAFELRPEEDLNAYADGKKVYVTVSMMRFAADDAMLALVLSHEYAHNVMDHVSSQQLNGMAGVLLGGILDAAAATQGINTQSAGMRIGSGVAGMVYSKDFEREADYVGLYIMARAGYPIDKAAELWRKMTIVAPDGAFMAGTHPSNPERYVLLKKTAAEIEKKRAIGAPLVPNASRK